MRVVVILMLWAGMLPREGLSVGASPGASVNDSSGKATGTQTVAMTWCAGGPGRRENMDVGALRVFEIELSGSPPQGAESPAAPGTRYGVAQFADEGKSRFLCGLRTTFTQGERQDDFLIDVNRNGSLEDSEVFKGKAVLEGLTAWEFGTIDLMLQGPSGPRKHRVFVHTNKYGPLYLTSHCYTRGRISWGDREVEAVLVDYNCDGRYASGKVSEEDIGSLGPRELDYDLIGWDANGNGRIEWTEQHSIGSYAVCGNKVYRIDCSTDGLTVTITPSDLPMGRLQMPAGNAFVRLIGPLGPFSLLMPDGVAAVPAGTYPVDIAVVWETADMSGPTRFRKSGQYFEKPWTIQPGATTTIKADDLVVTTDDQQRYKAKIEARSGVPQPQIPSRLHTPLGDLKEFGIDIGQTAADKRILLCFFDPNQRPSRHCIAQIAQQQEQLRQKDLVIVLISTSPITPQPVRTWLMEQNISLPLGEIKAGLELTKVKWGIRSLPWLIFTDRDHVVTAEGFTVSELDAKITDVGSPAPEDLDKAVITVTDKQGNVLADVHVTECETEEQFTTGVKGQFTCKPSDQMRFFYAVDKHHKLTLIGRLGASQRRLNMELLPARVVSGRVVDPNGRPVAGVQIAPMPMSSFCTLTNEEGQFDVGWLPDWEPRGGLCLMARHVERNLAALVDISRQAVRVDIQLAPALTLSGTVVTADGAPLSGATVSLLLRKWNWGCGTPVKRAVADPSGRFTLPALPQLQEYELHARAADYVAEELTTGVINSIKDREEIGPIVLVKRAPPDAGNEMGRLGLKIVDENLKPVDVTSVQIWKKQPDGGAHAESVLLVSGRTPGLYEIEPVPAGKYYALSIHVEGYAPFRLSDVEVRKEPQEVITCQLSRGGTIQGIVTDEEGKPVVGLPVVVNSDLCMRDVKTDPNGYFVATHLPDTRYTVIVTPPSESPYATTILRGYVSCGARDLHIVVTQKREVKSPQSLIGTDIWQVSQLTLPLEPPTAKGKAILLCLFDMDQRPSRNCLQQLTKRATELAEKGVVTVAVQVPTVDRTGLDTWVKENAIPFSIGMIRDAEDRTLVAWGVKSLPWLILTDRQHTVIAEGFGASELDAKITPISPPAAQDPDGAVITVTDKQGNVLAGVYIIDCETQEQYTTDVKGRFACRRSDQMQYFYAVDKKRGLALVAPLPGGARQLTVELRPAQLISGRVTDPAGRPVAGVQVASLPVTSVCVLTNEQGQFDVGLLPTWKPRGLCLMARHVERNLAATVDISWQAARVDIQLAPALSLSGTVTTAEGTPLSGATVSVVLRKWNWGNYLRVKRAVADERGCFTVPALPQLQEYELHARAADYVAEELTTGVISVIKNREEIGPIVLAKTAPPETSNEMGRLRIRVVDEDLRPVDVASAQIWKKRPDGGAQAETVLLVSNRTPGLYEIDPLPTGKYHALSMDVEGFARFWRPDVEVRREPQEVITCKLSRGGTIAGVVTDDTGKPLAGLPVVVCSTLCKRELTTDPNGHFATSNLPDVRYSVVVEPQAESPYATAVLIGGASCGAGDRRIVVRRKTEVKSPTSLIGTNIWQVSQLTLPLEPPTAKGKAILLCLFDLDQRPSRNCLQQLAKRAKELAEKDVVTAAIQVPTVDRTQLDKWAKENAIPFPIGRIRDTEDRNLTAWGVKSLPWLILTDEEHVVAAEGFAPNELNSRLK